MTKPIYRVTMQGLPGYKEFNNKHKLRLWLMNYLAKEDIVGLDIKWVNRK